MTVTTPHGQVLRDEDGMRLEFVRTYPDPIADVWSALTDPVRTARWIGTWTGDPSTGAVELFMAEDEGSTPETVTILACRPPTRLRDRKKTTCAASTTPPLSQRAFRRPAAQVVFFQALIIDHPSPDGTWRLSVLLHEEEGVTTLVFTQRLAPPYDASNIGPGWHYYLDRLGAVVAGEPVPDQWDDYFPALADAYAAPG